MSNVMIVDDSKTIRASVRFMLPKEEFNLYEAADGQEGLNKLEEKIGAGETIHMIVTDYNMPNMNGIEFIKKVKDKWPDIPVLVATTESESTKRMEGKEAGAVGWLVKPYNPDQFLEVVRRFT